MSLKEFSVFLSISIQSENDNYICISILGRSSNLLFSVSKFVPPFIYDEHYPFHCLLYYPFFPWVFISVVRVLCSFLFFFFRPLSYFWCLSIPVYPSCTARFFLNESYHSKKELVKQKSREKNLDLGDSHSKYFYYMINSSKKRAFISSITDSEGNVQTKPDNNEEASISYFQRILAPNEQNQARLSYLM